MGIELLFVSKWDDEDGANMVADEDDVGDDGERLDADEEHEY